MAVLKEQEAISYLQRAQSTINPDHHYFSHLPLLYKMLEIEAAYLQKLTTDEAPGPLPDVDIQPNGFPQLNSWLIDINKAFRVIRQLRTSRAKDLIPILQQFANASPDGIVQTSEHIAPTFDYDRLLVKAVEGLKPEQLNLLRSIHDSPFMNRDEAPGMLVVYDRSVEEYLKESAKKDIKDKIYYKNRSSRFCNLPLYVGLKYIDAEVAKRSARTPVLLYVPLAAELNDPLKISVIHVLTPNITLDDTFSNPERVYLPLNSHIPRSNVREERSKYSNKSETIPTDKAPSDYKTIMQLDEITTKSRPPVLQWLLSIDTLSLPTSQIDKLFDKLPQFNALVDDIVNSYTEIVYGSSISTEEFTAKNAQFAKRLQTIFNAFDNDSIRQALQFAIAEGVKPVRQEAEKIANPSRSIVVYEDKTTQPSQTGTPAPTGFKRFTSWFNR